METREILYDFGSLTQSKVAVDLVNPIHLRDTVVLDHEVNGELLKQAWDRTKRVYPLIDAVLGSDNGENVMEYVMDAEFRASHMDDHFYLVRAASGVNDPVQSKVPVSPGTDAVGYRTTCISYYGNQVSISTYHALADGYGINKIFSTLLYSYLALYTGHEDEHPIVELREGRSLEEYYVEKTTAYTYSIPYTPVPIFTFPYGCKGFIDDDMVNDDGHVYTATLNVGVNDFIGLCKSTGANPSAMLAALLARTAYDLNPDESRDLIFEFTVSEKKPLGLTDSIANVIGLAYSYVSRSAIENKTLAEVTQAIRSDVDAQRTVDYIVSFARVRDMLHSPGVPMPFSSRVITYLGALNIGENNTHIIDGWLETYGGENLYMRQINDEFHITLMYGRATERYMAGLIKTLASVGISSELIHPVHYVLPDSRTAVL